MNDSASIKEQQEWWETILPDKLSLVCLMRDSENTSIEPQIAGINFLYYHHKSHDEINCEVATIFIFRIIFTFKNFILV